MTPGVTLQRRCASSSDRADRAARHSYPPPRPPTWLLLLVPERANCASGYGCERVGRARIMRRVLTPHLVLLAPPYSIPPEYECIVPDVVSRRMTARPAPRTLNTNTALEHPALALLALEKHPGSSAYLPSRGMIILYIYINIYLYNIYIETRINAHILSYTYRLYLTTTRSPRSDDVCAGCRAGSDALQSGCHTIYIAYICCACALLLICCVPRSVAAASAHSTVGTGARRSSTRGASPAPRPSAASRLPRASQDPMHLRRQPRSVAPAQSRPSP